MVTLHIFTENNTMVVVNCKEVKKSAVRGKTCFAIVDAYGGWWEVYSIDGDAVAVFTEEDFL